jgi:hypothetical protein
MSTKTNFKRVALVTVAALGLGILSSVPSQAVGNLSVTIVNGSFKTGQSDSTTAATISVSAVIENTNDTITVGVVPNGTLADSVTVARGTNAQVAHLIYLDTTTAARSLVGVLTAANAASVTAPSNVTTSKLDSQTVQGAGVYAITAASTGNVGAKFGIQIDSTTSAAIAGTYSFTVFVRMYSNGTAIPITSSYTANIVVDAAASASTTPAPGLSTAFIGAGSTVATTDAVVSALATASTTAAATLAVRTYNASGTSFPVAESITATITGAGLLSFGGISGSSLTIAGTGSSNISVLPNGVAGTATIAISTTSRTFPAKTMTFYAAAPTTLVASVATPLAAIGDQKDVVRVVAKDSAGVSWAGALYIYASTAADALIAGSLTTPVLCTWDGNDDRHECSVSGLSAGTAKFKTINASTVAAATVTSNEVSVVVSQASAATVKIEFDKASYAPGERARIYVTPLDSTGKAMQATAFSNLLATGGISTASALTFAGSTTTADSLTAVAITTKGNSSSTSGAKAGSFELTVYMPVAGGTVTISATGGSSLPIAGRVAVTASATVTDSGAAALAAVTALATTVASLKTLITTLTNLVLKIQKKVKA